MRGRLVLDATAAEFAAACGAGGRALDVMVVDVVADDGEARRPIQIAPARRAYFDPADGTGAPVRVLLAPRQEEPL